MPLRYVRRKLTLENALTVAVATTSVTHELADLLQFPPARAATGILLLIFQTIQAIQTNRTACYRLARRCLTLLTDLRDAMDGRWDDAPEPLLKAIAKFETTLQTIYDDLQSEAEHKWTKRLKRKTTIEAALVEHHSMLDDAARSFQIVTLIHIHYAIERAKDDNRGLRKLDTESTTTLRPTGSIAALASDSDTFCDSPGSLTFSDAEIVSTPADSRSASEFTLVDFPTIESAIPSAVILPTEVHTKDEDYQEPLDDRGFRRYHQSELSFKGSSKIKSGWWAGAKEVQVEGRQLLMLPYDGPHGGAVKRWIKDVKLLQNVFHPNLPQMVGYSGTEAPTPFILLANVQTRLPQAMVLDALKNATLLDCARLLIRFYKDIFDASVYMQRQLSLTESKTQDYVEHASFRIEGLDTMVMGLPPPEVHNMQSYRNFGLAHSIQGIFIQLMPNRGISRKPYDPGDDGKCHIPTQTTVDLDAGILGSPEMQRKINHLGLIVRSVLPNNDEVQIASARLTELLGDEEDEEAEPLSLPMIRMSAIQARTHGMSWSENFVPAHMFHIGDIGYIPPGEGVKSFVRLKNVLEEGIADWEVKSPATGWKTHFDMGRFDQQELQPFELPGDVCGWALVLDAGTRQNVQLVHEKAVRYVSDAWKLLLVCARDIAKTHGVKPEDLMLVTRAGIDQRFIIHDLRHVPPPHFSQQHHHHRPGFPPQFGGTHPNMHGHSHFHHAIPGFGPPPPAVFYAFTSIEEGHEPYISETPAYLPPALQAQRPPMRAQCAWGLEGTFGFMNYVQLHEEDFL
ncbi:hypothetical protein BDW22DRAFT_341386 [Trametopsis cervina]|nr:hypothetical protein BDW22DRAFT_341386 [Trametopsis cervina]